MLFPVSQSPLSCCLYRTCIFIKEKEHYHALLQQIVTETEKIRWGGGKQQEKAIKTLLLAATWCVRAPEQGWCRSEMDEIQKGLLKPR